MCNRVLCAVAIAAITYVWTFPLRAEDGGVRGAAPTQALQSLLKRKAERQRVTRIPDARSSVDEKSDSKRTIGVRPLNKSKSKGSNKIVQDAESDDFECDPGYKPVGDYCYPEWAAVCDDGSYCDQGASYCNVQNVCVFPGETDCGDYTCNAGYTCRSDGGCMPAGHVDCGDFSCQPGNVCTSWGCMPQGGIDCGSYYCEAGDVCSRDDDCIPEGTVDCGRGYYCEQGASYCNVQNVRVFPGETDCGDHACSAGYTCRSDGGCMPAGHVDCGDFSCQPGNVCTSWGCMPEGYIDCGTYSCKPGYACASHGRCTPPGFHDCGTHFCRLGKLCANRAPNGCMDQGQIDCSVDFLAIYCSAADSVCCKEGGGCCPKDKQ